MAANGVDFAQNAIRFKREEQSQMSSEISRLLTRAIDCIEHDRFVALDFIRKASTLLAPHLDHAGEAGKVRGLAPWQVKRLKAVIEERISETIPLDELAQVAKLSTNYFSAAFKVSFGTSPHNYILSRRVEHAKHRMISSEAPLCEIALDCGMADQAHLSRVFRKMTGTTPSAWRRYAATPDAADERRWPLTQVA